MEEESVYFVVENGRGEMLPYVTVFRSRSTYAPKAYKAERRKLERKGLSPEAASMEAGRNVLLYLVERAEPQKREDLLRNGLRLIEVRISVEGTRLREDKTLVAEIHPESDEVR